MRVLFTTPILEHPPAGGPALRIENSIKALSMVCELDLFHVAYEPSPQADRTKEFYKKYAGEYFNFFIYPHSSVGLSKVGRVKRRIGRSLSSTVSHQADVILEHVDRREIDTIWFGYGNISYKLIREIKKRRPSIRVVSDTDSVWSRFIMREVPYSKGLRRLKIFISGTLKRLEERKSVNLCDITTAVSDVDALYYRKIARDPNKVHIFSNVIDVENYDKSVAPPNKFKKPAIYLAGTFGHSNSPMDVATRWVWEQVLPAVWSHRPDVHFYLIGRNSDRSFGHLTGSNVTVTGTLDSVLPYLKNADVALVPLMFESGTRFKILEAGVCKVPLVSTTLGAEGLPVVNGENILLADSSEEFALAIIRLLQDTTTARRLAENMHQLVLHKFSVEAMIKEASHILGHLRRD